MSVIEGDAEQCNIIFTFGVIKMATSFVLKHILTTNKEIV